MSSSSIRQFCLFQWSDLVSLVFMPTEIWCTLLQWCNWGVKTNWSELSTLGGCRDFGLVHINQKALNFEFCNNCLSFFLLFQNCQKSKPKLKVKLSSLHSKTYINNKRSNTASLHMFGKSHICVTWRHYTPDCLLTIFHNSKWHFRQNNSLEILIILCLLLRLWHAYFYVIGVIPTNLLNNHCCQFSLPAVKSVWGEAA